MQEMSKVCFGKHNTDFFQLKNNPRALFADLELRLGSEQLKPREGGSEEPHASSQGIATTRAESTGSPSEAQQQSNSLYPWAKSISRASGSQWFWLVRRAGTGTSSCCACGDFPLAQLVTAGNSGDARRVPSAASCPKPSLVTAGKPVQAALVFFLPCL